MPIIASAKKRVRTARKATVRNSKTKRSLKSALKVLASSPSGKSISAAQSQIDRAAKKGVIHRNKAARLKSQAAKKAKAAGAKSTKAVKKAAPAKKAAAKKPVTKKK
jgi:small subunit ribosomal protein S20